MGIENGGGLGIRKEKSEKEKYEGGVSQNILFYGQ